MRTIPNISLSSEYATIFSSRQRHRSIRMVVSGDCHVIVFFLLLLLSPSSSGAAFTTTCTTPSSSSSKSTMVRWVVAQQRPTPSSSSLGVLLPQDWGRPAGVMTPPLGSGCGKRRTLMSSVSLEATPSSSSSSSPSVHWDGPTNGDDLVRTTMENKEDTTMIDPDYADYYNPNGIRPRTDPLPTSVAYFVQFTLNLFRTNRRRKHLLQLRQQRLLQLQRALQSDMSDSKPGKKKLPAWYRNLLHLDQQRKNLVTLADYTAKIVAPSFIFLILGALTTSIVPRYTAMSIQLVATLDTNRLHVVEALGGLAIFTTLEALFTGMRGSLFWIAGTRANYNIRVKLHRSLLLQETAFFDSHETGYLLSRLNSDVNKIGSVISYHVNVVCRQLAQFVFGSLYMIQIAPLLSAYTFLGIVLVAWVSAVYGEFNRDLAQRVQNTYADATAVAETSFSMSETIRAFDGVDMESQKYEAAQHKALMLEEVQAWGYGLHKFVSDTLQAGLHLLLFLSCWRVGTAGGLPAAQLTTFLFYTNFVLESSNEVGDQWAKIQGAVGASTSVFDLIRRVPKIRDSPGGHRTAIAPIKNHTTVIPNANGAGSGSSTSLSLSPIVEISNLTIKYGAMENPALDGVDLRVLPGDRVAIVGRSGSGKSSMLRALLRFYDPSIGSVKLQNKDLREMPRSELANKVAFVEQEPALFPMTLLENVLYGVPKDAVDPSTGEPCYSADLREQVVESLRVVGLPIHPGNDLNLGLDTRVGDGGRALSGGQRQRVAIARALIRSPAVLLLDEPTSALDSESEKQVIGALRKTMEHSTCMVMVTHRLGAIRSLGVNRVVVMEKGRIIESGHPESLLRIEHGRFASLAREQGIVAYNNRPREANV